MRASTRLHPVAFSAQVLSAVAVAVCTLNPVILLLSLSAAFTTLLLRERPPKRGELLLPLLILLLFPYFTGNITPVIGKNKNSKA